MCRGELCSPVIEQRVYVTLFYLCGTMWAPEGSTLGVHRPLQFVGYHFCRGGYHPPVIYNLYVHFYYADTARRVPTSDYSDISDM